MKKTAILLGIFAIIIIAASTIFSKPNEMPPNNPNNPTVAATIFPIYDIARTIAGDDLNVTLVLPPGASPHTFDPSPSLLRELQNAQSVFIIGHELDEWVQNIVPNTATFVQVDNNVPLKESAGHEEHEDEHDDEHAGEDEHVHGHGPTDPHYWLDPRNAEHIAKTITAELIKLAPEKQANIEQRQNTFLAKLETNITNWETKIASIKGKNFATLHDAFYYFADFTNTNLSITFEPNPGKEPTPQYLVHLSEKIEEHNIVALFNEPQLSFSAISSFANDNNVKTGTLDPLGGVDDRMSYFDLIEYNINTLLAALK